MIYFIGNTTESKVKIGYSKHPDKRLKEIQTTAPFKVSILKVIPGNFIEEKKWHRHFAWCKTNNEWYTLTEELKEFINRKVS